MVVGREPGNNAPTMTCTADDKEVAVGQKPDGSELTQVCKVACASDTLGMVMPKPGSKPEVDGVATYPGSKSSCCIGIGTEATRS